MANHQLNLLRRHVERAKEDYSAITLPMKRMALLTEKRTINTKRVSFDEPLKTREIAAGMSELRDIEVQFAALFNLAQKINDEEALLNIVNTMEKQVKAIEGKSALELAGGKRILLFEELGLIKFEKSCMAALSEFVAFVRPKDDLLLSPDANDGGIYMGNLGTKVGRFERRIVPLDSADNLCARHYPISSASYNEKTEEFEVEHVPIRIEIPGNRMIADPFKAMGTLLKKAKLSPEKFIDKITDILANLGADGNDALRELNRESNYCFVFRSLETPERPDKSNGFLQIRTEAKVSVAFGRKHGDGQNDFGVEATLVVPEMKMKLVSWVGTNRFVNHEAHAELVLEKPDLGMGPEQLN